MNQIPSYSSIYNLGHKAITDLFKQPVIIEEKVDGSQFSFVRLLDGTLLFRSKGAVIHAEAPEKLFTKAVEAVKAVADKLPHNMIFRGEYLAGPKHNTLCYDRAPKGNIIIFDIDDGNQNFMSYERKKAWAEEFGFEVVPLLFEGMVTEPDQLRSYLETVSVLGGQKIEGMVIKPKNYDLFGRDHNVLMGKFVSEAFREVHKVAWKGNKTPGTNDIITILAASYGTQSRWDKAIQHLRDAGQLEDSPRDIGKLMAEVPADVLKECEEEIREKLFKWAWPQLRRVITRGLPEWYKDLLMKKQFADGDTASVALNSTLPMEEQGEARGVPTPSAEPFSGPDNASVQADRLATGDRATTEAESGNGTVEQISLDAEKNGVGVSDASPDRKDAGDMASPGIPVC